MAVSFDAVGAGASATTGSSPFTKTWAHTASGSNGAVLVAFDISLLAGLSTATISVTYGGVAMTQLGIKGPNNATTSGGFSAVYGLLNPPTGAQTVSVTVTQVSGRILGFVGNSFSYAGVGSFGTAVTNFGDSTAASVAVTGGVTGGMDFALISGLATLSAFSQTSRYALASGSAYAVAGDAAGASSVTFSAALSAVNSWDAIGVPLLPVGGGTITAPSNLFFSMF